MGEIESIHGKLDYQTITYFWHRIDWPEWISAETSTAWGFFATFSLSMWGIGIQMFECLLISISTLQF
jgi:hypothetical protein